MTRKLKLLPKSGWNEADSDAFARHDINRSWRIESERFEPKTKDWDEDLAAMVDAGQVRLGRRF